MVNRFINETGIPSYEKDNTYENTCKYCTGMLIDPCKNCTGLDCVCCENNPNFNY